MSASGHGTRSWVLCTTLGLAVAGCGDDGGAAGDGGGPDGSAQDGGGLDGASGDATTGGDATAGSDAAPSDATTVPSDGMVTGDGGVPADGAFGSDGAAPVNCVSLGEPCQSSFECCGPNTCQPDATGARRCVADTFCVPSGGSCTQSSECCSLRCTDGSCASSGGLCVPTGEACTGDAECCSNDCDTGGTDTCLALGTGCATLGERCDTEGFDMDCCSKNCLNFGSGAEPDLRCARSSTCGARGEICVEDEECCSGVCLDGRCPTQNQVGQKRFVGEPCQQDSDCASYACAPTYRGGPLVCQFQGGCRPAEEICTEDWQCCGYYELSPSRNSCMAEELQDGMGCTAIDGVPGLSTCQLQENAKEVGEICREPDGTRVHDCCGGDEVCQQTITGAWRCLGPGGGGECVGDGETCRIADDCCSNVCVPVTVDGMTELRCSDTCVEDGDQCTTDADCCNFSCVDGVCEPPPSAPDGGTPDGGVDGGTDVCIPLGGACTDSSECCSEYCDGTCQTILF